MKVLLVSHNFLPAHTGGTEIYTLQLGQHLDRRGHDVHVFTAEKDIGRRDMSLHEREFGGLPVTELVNNLHYQEFEESWTNSRVDEVFDRFLERYEPDVVHFQHLLYLSVGCVERAAARGIPAILTLHDYWLQCPRYGQRVHADSSICHTIDFERCGECLSSFKFRQTSIEQETGKWIARIRGVSGLDLGPLARSAARSLQQRRPRDPAFQPEDLDPDRVRVMTEAAARRDRTLRESLLSSVQVFLSPSRFLRETFVTWGIPEERIHFVRTGIDLEHFGGGERRTSERKRVAFIGSLIPAKGPDVLLEAWKLLPREVRAAADLSIFGPERHEPNYARHLRELATEVGATLEGGLRRELVAQALLGIDLLVVPSVWYENSPLVIVEAIATRTPLLVSDIGGMAELVRPGAVGYHFKTGDARDLASVLTRLLSEPEELGRLYAAPEPIKRVERDAEQMEEVYFEAIDAVRATTLDSDS